MEHAIVWERAHGAIPPGMQLHHIDRNKLHNELSNLELVSPLAHKREHSGCFECDGVTYKPCCKCNGPYPVDRYYKRRDGISPWCRPCCIRNAIENKRKRTRRADVNSSDHEAS